MGFYATNQFDFIKNIGQGAYGSVFHVKRRQTGLEYALKQLEKDHILKYDKKDAVYRERDISCKLSDHPNIVGFLGTFTDEDHLYFLLEFCPYGSL